MKKNVDKFIWRAKDNKIISCDETNKVLNENFNEIENVIQSAYDDAVLIDCDETHFKNTISDPFDVKFLSFAQLLEFINILPPVNSCFFGLSGKKRPPKI